MIIEFPEKVAVEKDLRIHLSCDGVAELQYRFARATLEVAAGFYSSTEAYMAVRTESIAHFVYDVNCLARALHLLTHWDGEDVHEIMVALNFVEWLAKSSGWPAEDLLDLRRRITPLPDDVWPDGMDLSGVWFWDKAGRTLVIDERGRLGEGLTVAERMRLAPIGDASARAEVRREERRQIFETVAERLRGHLEAPEEIEKRAAESHRPF